MSATTASFQDGLAAARAGDRLATLKIAAQQVFFGLFPAFVFLLLLHGTLTARGYIAVDFSNAYWTAAHRLLTGGDPYYWTNAQLAGGVSFVYPAFSALVYLPFALFGRGTAGSLDLLVSVGVAPLTIWVLNVRDWRVYGLIWLWPPVMAAWTSGNETIILVLLTALAWRYRDRPVVAGLLTAAAISMKPLVWPLALWLLVTRRWRASIWALVCGIAINVVSWTVVGPSQVQVFLRDSKLDTDFSWRHGYSLDALCGHLGLTHSAGNLMTMVVCGALVILVAYVGFVRRDERRAFTLAIGLMLLASPLIWTHYFAFLLVPIAIDNPRLGRLWLVPVLMWFCPVSKDVTLLQLLVAWAATGIVLTSLTIKPSQRPAA